jgi:hypothetical protein
MTVCVLCDRLLPQGGVLDGVGRPVHYVCKMLEQRRIADAAQFTAARVRSGRVQRSDLDTARVSLYEGCSP